MLFKSIAAAAAVFGVASATNFIPVAVGAKADGSLGAVFTPDRIEAPVGSVVQFQFWGGNHSVTQSSFDSPCVPPTSMNASATSLHSGFFPAANNNDTGMVPVWNIMINDTKPIWLYCAQGSHCQNGMGMVINENTAANETRSLENYKALAVDAPDSEIPGGVTTGAGSPAVVPTPSNTTTTATQAPTTATSTETEVEVETPTFGANDLAGTTTTDVPILAGAAGVRVSAALMAVVAGAAFLAL